MNWEEVIKIDTEGSRALDVLYDAYEKLEKSKDEVLKMINEEDKAEAEKEFNKLSKPDKQGMVRIMAIFHGRKKIKQNFYD